MTDRIDAYLDGTIERTDLTPAEQAQADAAGRAIHDARAFVGAHEPPDLSASVMSRIGSLRPDAIPSRAWTRWLAGLWTPREISFQLRPAYAAFAVAAIAVLVVFVPLGRQRAPSPVAAAPSDPHVFVQFRLQAPDAMDVRLAGTFTEWEPRYELHESASGVWTITVPLTPGVHDYVFVVDGRQWVPDPDAQQVADGFGGTNSRIALLIPDAPRS